MATEFGGGGRGEDGEGRDQRPVLGLALAALAILIVPAVEMLNPRPAHVIDEGPEPYLTAAQEIDAFWRREFASQFPAADESYTTPRVVFADAARRLASAPGDFAGYYAEDAETIRIIVDEPAEFVFFVIAHEFGHHVQALSGLSQRRDALVRRSWSVERRRRISLRYELQAECLAGVWAAEAAAGGRLVDAYDVEHWRTAITLGRDSDTHGTAAQRLKWFDVGYFSGRASECDTFAPAWDRL